MSSREELDLSVAYTRLLVPQEQYALLIYADKAARILGLQIEGLFLIRAPEELERAFTDMAARQVQAVLAAPRAFSPRAATGSQRSLFGTGCAHLEPYRPG